MYSKLDHIAGAFLHLSEPEIWGNEQDRVKFMEMIFRNSTLENRKLSESPHTPSELLGISSQIMDHVYLYVDATSLQTEESRKSL